MDKQIMNDEILETVSGGMFGGFSHHRHTQNNDTPQLHGPEHHHDAEGNIVYLAPAHKHDAAGNVIYYF